MKKGTTTTSAYGNTSTPDYYAVITIRVKDKASRIEIDAPSGMYSQITMGVEYGFTPETFNTSADVLIADFEKQMISSDANSGW